MKLELIKKADIEGNWFHIVINGTTEKSFKYTSETYNLKLIEAVTWFNRYKEPYQNINKKDFVSSFEVIKSVTI